MIRTYASPGAHLFGLVVLMAGGLVLGILSCAGPQPLHMAINPRDEDAYRAYLNEFNGNAATAYAQLMADERRTTAAEILEADERVSETRNSFDAHRDSRAVSRGAVIYKRHCADCHGEDARGHGPMSEEAHPPTDFKSPGKRLAATLHRGAPKKWFRVIRDGTGEEIEYLGERTTAMPAFGHKLTREQIWLVITYLQSLDMHAKESQNRGHTQ